VATRNRDSRVDDLFKAEADISSIKKLMAQVATVAFSAIFGIGVWVGSNDTKLSRLESSFNDVESRQRSNDILSARIETKLLSIEATLIEIKHSIK